MMGPAFLVSSVIHLVKHNVMYDFFIFCSRWWEEHPPGWLFELEKILSEFLQQLPLKMPICFGPLCSLSSAPLGLLFFMALAWFKVHFIDFFLGVLCPHPAHVGCRQHVPCWHNGLLLAAALMYIVVPNEHVPQIWCLQIKPPGLPIVGDIEMRHGDM